MSTVFLGTLFVVSVSCDGERASPSADSTAGVSKSPVRDDSLGQPTAAVTSAVLTLTVDDQNTPSDGADESRIADVNAIVVGSKGDVYAWDPISPALWMIDAGTKQIRQVSRTGSGPGEYVRVNGLAVTSNGELVVWDGGNTRISVYSSDGTYLRAFNVPPQARFLSDALTVDSLGRIALEVGLRDPRQPLAPSRRAWLRFDLATGAALDTVVVPTDSEPAANLTASRAANGRLQALVSYPVPFTSVVVAALDRGGQLIWGRTGAYELKRNGNSQMPDITREYTPVVVSNDEAEVLRSEIVRRMQRTDPNWQWNAQPIPSAKPPIVDVRVTTDGRVWVEVAMPSVRGRSSGTGVAETQYRPATRRWDVYDPDGSYWASVETSASISLGDARGDSVWGIVRSEDGVPRLVKLLLGQAK